MLNANKMMGTMIGRRQQMQDIKDGKATCILKGKFTAVRPGTSHIAFHHHVGAGVRRATDWPAQENLVAHLRRLDGSCIVGPFMDADDLLRESKDGRRYKLGTGMTREVVQAMLALKGGRLWVYMFYPAEACPALVWNEDEGGAASSLEGWDYFVYNMRGERLSDDVWFYLRRQAGSAGSRLPLTMTTGPTTAATTMNYATALVMGVGGAGAVDFGAVGYRAVVLEDMLPTNEWGSMDDQQDAVHASDGGGMMMGAGDGGGVARAEARPVQVSLSMLEMLEATRVRTVVEQPVFVSEAVQDMLRLTRERCEQLLQVDPGSMNAGLLGALRMMRGALVGMEVAVSMGGMAIGGSLGDIMNALQQYQWAMEDAGNPAADIERVRVVWLALSSLHARVLTLARYGYADINGGGGVAAGPIPFD